MTSTTMTPSLALVPSLQTAWQDVDSSFERFCIRNRLRVPAFPKWSPRTIAPEPVHEGSRNPASVTTHSGGISFGE